MITRLNIKYLRLKMSEIRTSKFVLRNERGAYLPVIMLISTLFMTLALAVVTLSLSNLKTAKNYESTISAVEVAESGINYYMWHLSHNNLDYCDGITCVGNGPYGPYTHDFKDKDGKVVGTYEITITPPKLGDAVTSVKAVGRVFNSQIKRTVTAELGMPSFARYAFLSNTECWFGSNEATNGPVHSNAGVHFDGTANGVVSASNETYKPSSSFGGDGQTKAGVWGIGGPKNYWVYPVPTIDFNRVSVDFVNLKTKAATGGIYLAGSNSQGYYLKLKSDKKIDVYRVSRERSDGITSTFLETKNAPSNGIIYAEDNLWIDGTWSDHLTIVANGLKNTQPIIKIKDNLLYADKDGSASIGLVAQGNIEVPGYAVNNLEIDAALLSQNGHIWFPNVSGAVKNSINVYGSMATNLYWTWTWVSGSTVISGYRTTSQTFDPFLTLTPPPEFPTTGSYAILNWREE